MKLDQFYFFVFIYARGGQMKNKSGQKLLKALMVMTMIFSVFTVPVRAEGSSTWESAGSIAEAAAGGEPVAITMTATDGTVYALPTGKASTGGPTAFIAEKGDSGDLVLDGDEAAYGWTISQDESG